ncbi:MAG: OsmC family protein [Calditrichota bacterium]
MKAYLRHVDGHIFVAKSDSNHWVPIDTGTASGGTAAANDPFQLFVIGFSGCSFVDIVDIVKKSRKAISTLELHIEVTRAESTPKVIRGIEFHLQAQGEDSVLDTLRRAMDLSLTKYCSASISLDRSIPFTCRITLNGNSGEAWIINRNSLQYFE